MDTISRFIRRDDPHAQHCVYDMPDGWWSRPYEYTFALQYANSLDVVLDAACGIPHPLKFALCDRGCDVYACDTDTRLGDYSAMQADVGVDISRYIGAIQYRIASLVSLPYADTMFDTVFCVSVLEHLSQDDQRKTLAEFARVLKCGGRLVLTMDYPTVNVHTFSQQVVEYGFSFIGDLDTEYPDDALRNDAWGLSCFRMVLVR